MGLVRATALVVFSLALLGAADDPLPRVRSKSDVPPVNTNEPQASSTLTFDMPLIALAVEPIAAVTVDVRDAASATAAMREALATNDAPRFEAAYKRARELGANVAAYDDIEKVWSFANSDPNGAFYGSEMHDRLAAKYPAYARYIEQYRLVDARGQVWYPTSETRTFLAKQLRGGEGATSPVVKARKAPAAEPKRRHAVLQKAELRRDAAAPAGVDAGAPSHDVLANDIHNAAKPPVAVAPVEPVKADVAAGSGGATILFVVLAMLAAGVVTLFVRTPKPEEPPAEIFPITRAS